MKRQPPAEHTQRVVTLAVAFFGSIAALGWAEGVFAKFAAGELLALAAFAAGFTLLTYAADRQVHALVNGALTRIRAALSHAVSGNRPSAKGML